MITRRSGERAIKSIFLIYKKTSLLTWNCSIKRALRAQQQEQHRAAVYDEQRLDEISPGMPGL
jgi:hypothetical protein